MLVHDFSFTISDKWQPNDLPVLINEGDEVKIFIDDNKISTGYIDTPEIGESPKSHPVSFEGRSKTEDLVDCSALHDPSSWKNIDLFFLATTLCEPFGISVIQEGIIRSDKFDFKLKTSESPFEAIDRKAREFGVVLKTNTDGNLVLTNNIKTTAKTRLQTPFNIVSYAKRSSLADRFSEYRVKGQDKSNGKESYSETMGKIFGVATDTFVPRYRPKIIKESNATTAKFAQKKANWIANVRYGKSFELRVQVQGFYQPGFDELWKVNELVEVAIRKIDLKQKLLLAEYEFSKSADGSVTNLIFVRPEAFLADPLSDVKKQVRTVKVKPVVDPPANKNDANFFGGSGKTRGVGYTGSWGKELPPKIPYPEGI